MDWIIIIILSTTLITYKIFKIGDLFSPWSITTIVWLGIIFLFQIENDLLYPLSNQFYTSLFIWIPIFCMSSIFSFYAFPAFKDYSPEQSFRVGAINHSIYNVFFILTMIMTPLYVYQILKIVMMFDTTDLLFNLRYYAVNGENDFGIIKYSYIINLTLYVISIWEYPKISKLKLFAVLIALLMSQFALMEKNGLFLLAVSTLFALYSKRKITARTIAFTFLAIVFLFFFINFSKEIKSDSQAESASFLDFIGVYILSPSVAFGYITPDLSNQFGAHCFSYFYNILDSLGIGNYVLYERLQGYVLVPLPTNVYTIFQPIYQDFGYMGIGVFAFLYGTLTGVAYRLYYYGNIIAICTYTYLAKVLFVQFYHEDFIMSIATFGQFILLVTIISLTWRTPQEKQPESPQETQLLAI